MARHGPILSENDARRLKTILQQDFRAKIIKQNIKYACIALGNVTHELETI